MHIILVHVHVKEDQVKAFEEATIINAMNSVKEPDIARFDVIQQEHDPTRFILVEVYRSSKDGPARHKETDHYQNWRETVSPMMAESRTALFYRNIYPEEPGWDMPS